MRNKSFVIKDLSSGESSEFAVVTHGEAFEGKWKRKVLFIHDWFNKLDDACACAYRMNEDVSE
jgi:hypothetical protein